MIKRDPQRPESVDGHPCLIHANATYVYTYIYTYMDVCICMCVYIHVLPATGSSQAISAFAGMYRRKGPDLCCAQTQGTRRTHALPAPHHKSNLTLPTDAVPSQTKRVIYLRVREHTNARRRSQSGLPQRSRKQKQTKATKAALGPERPSKKQEPRQADGDRTSRRCQAAKAKRRKVTG